MEEVLQSWTSVLRAGASPTNRQTAEDVVVDGCLCQCCPTLGGQPCLGRQSDDGGCLLLRDRARLASCCMRAERFGFVLVDVGLSNFFLKGLSPIFLSGSSFGLLISPSLYSFYFERGKYVGITLNFDDDDRNQHSTQPRQPN